jgi:hypothetical protein
MQINQTIQQPKTHNPCIIVIGAKETTKPCFDTVVIHAVDSALSILDNKQEIYRQLETKYKLSQLEIADNPEAFTAALKDMFGDSSLLIELKIISNLHNKVPDFKYRCKNQELTLSGYLQKMKKYWS